MDNDFLPTSLQLFRYYKSLSDKSMAALTLEQLHATPGQGDNSIAIIVQHMAGNMHSRWTDFLTTDGEKPDRQRDAEFTPQEWDKDQLLGFWESGWKCLFDAIEPLKEEELGQTVYIRNEGHSVQSAILRQLAHLPYHVGQIVYLAKWLQGEHWQSLSIPKGASASYNAEKFGKAPEKKFF